MASKISNLATLNYTSGTEDLSTDSNTASINMLGPVDVTKHALENAYHLGETITYHLFVTNGTNEPLDNVTIIDNLGRYTLPSTTSVVPLTYIKPSKVFIGGDLEQTLDGAIDAVDKSVKFTIASLDALTTMMLSYKVLVNEYAPATVGSSSIVNTVSVKSEDMALPVTATSTLPLALYTDIVVQKSMVPETVADGDDLTYTFDISNYGTRSATAARLRDVFDPIPSITDVYLGAQRLEADAYSMNATSGEFLYPAALTSTYAIDAATFTQDQTTGVVTPVPATSRLTIHATI